MHIHEEWRVQGGYSNSKTIIAEKRQHCLDWGKSATLHPAAKLYVALAAFTLFSCSKQNECFEIKETALIYLHCIAMNCSVIASNLSH